MNNGILNKRTSEIKYKTVFEKKIYCNNKFSNIIIVFLGGEFDKKKIIYLENKPFLVPQKRPPSAALLIIY